MFCWRKACWADQWQSSIRSSATGGLWLHSPSGVYVCIEKGTGQFHGLPSSRLQQVISDLLHASSIPTQSSWKTHQRPLVTLSGKYILKNPSFSVFPIREFKFFFSLLEKCMVRLVNAIKKSSIIQSKGMNKKTLGGHNWIAKNKKIKKWTRRMKTWKWNGFFLCFSLKWCIPIKRFYFYFFFFWRRENWLTLQN